MKSGIALQQYSEFVSGKRIAIVGPARSIEGSGWGREIDSHDIVIRINRGFPIIPELAADMGTQTDVLYHLGHVGIASNEREFKECVGKIRWIVCTQPGNTDTFKGFERMNHGRIAMSAIPQELKATVKKMTRKAPNAGILAIGHLIGMPIQSMKVFGFTFYEDGYHIGYGGRDRGESDRIKGGQRGHDQPSQKKILKNWMRRDPRIIVDDVLQKILDNTEDHLFKSNAEETVRMRALKVLAGREGLIYRGDIFFANPKRATLLMGKGNAEIIGNDVTIEQMEAA